MVIVKGRGGVHQQNIDVGFQPEILEAIVQHQRIHTVFFNGVKSGLDTVLIHDHAHIFQVAGEHVGFIAGVHGVQQQIFAVGNHPGRHFHLFRAEFLTQFFPEGPFIPAPVAAGKNRHFSALPAQSFGKDLHHRRLARPAAGQVPDTDDQTPDRPVADHPVFIHPQTQLHHIPVHAGKEKQQPHHNAVAEAMPFLFEQIQKVLLQIFSDFADRHFTRSLRSFSIIL